MVQVRATSEGIADISELLVNDGGVVLLAISVVVVNVLDLLGAAGGSGELNSHGEALRDDALFLGDLVSLVAGLAASIAVEVEGHCGGGVAASGLLEGALLVEGFTAGITLVILEDSFVGVSAVVGGGVASVVDVEEGEVVAEASGRSGGADGLHRFAVTEGRSVADVFGDLGDSAAVSAALTIRAFDHGDITSGVDEGDGGNDDDGSEEGENLGHDDCVFFNFSF